MPCHAMPWLIWCLDLIRDERNGLVMHMYVDDICVHERLLLSRGCSGAEGMGIREGNPLGRDSQLYSYVRTHSLYFSTVSSLRKFVGSQGGGGLLLAKRR